MTFKRWIMHFVDGDGSIGDLANDISTDDRFPEVNEHSAISYYLDSMNACDEAMRAFHISWRLYEKRGESNE